MKQLIAWLEALLEALRAHAWTKRAAIIAVAVLVVAGLYSLITFDRIAATPQGVSDGCRMAPAFVKQTKLVSPQFDTSRRDVTGLVMTDASNPDTALQQSSWKQFGSLGPLARDEHGAVYTANVPFINTLNSNQVTHLAVLRVDPQTGLLTNWLQLQGPPATANNYYGITALAYDCASHLLYVAAIAGSSQAQQSGFIAVVDPATRQEVFRYKDVDALSLAIFGGSSGRYLYMGSARRSAIERLALTSAGKPFGERAQVMQFDEFNRTRARKIAFSDKDVKITTTQFYYNLIASTDFGETVVTFRYDSVHDGFVALP